MAKSFNSTHEMDSETNDVIETDSFILPNSNEILRELTTLLAIDDGLQSEIVKNLLYQGRQVLISYKDDIIGDIYDEEMRENSKLLQLLKAYHQQRWETEYCMKFSWFRALIEEYERETKELYDRVLTRTAEYGDKYMNNCPLLSIAIQLLFESLSDDDMSTTFYDIWNSLTHDGLQSITQHSDYILAEIMNKQLEKSQENKPYGSLFMALREYYRNELVQYLRQSGVINRLNLHDLALDLVAEYGWLNGIKMIEQKTAKNTFVRLMGLINKIQKPTPDPTPDPIPDPTPDPIPDPISDPTPDPTPDPIPDPTTLFGNMTYYEKEKKRMYLEDLRRDLANMPSCAEKSIMELLSHFEDKLTEDHMPSQEDDTIILLLQKLQDQITKQELFSEKIRENFLDLKRYVGEHDVSSTVRSLGELLTKIRPLNIPEILRLVEKARKAGQLIYSKEIILLIGETGTGKSTTIQFLAGSKMKNIKVQVEPGRFLDHITVDGLIGNLELRKVTSSPRNKAETRYITPVTIQLKDIFGPHECGEIILCDAPGFGDTGGPEVDIANSVGVIEAIQGCESVKILALSSYKGLGDRGQGIQKLTHLLINMVHGIEGRLSAIFYAFTKYPKNFDINATLTDIKISKVETDPLLRNDSAFVTVLTDMINKTKNCAENIDPVHGDRKNIIQKLKNVRGIVYPKEAFRFSANEETQACIANQAQVDNSSIRCALKHKDIDLVMYYLNKLKILKDLLKHSTAGDAYEDAIRFISEGVADYCTGVTKIFNRSLTSQDGLAKEDIDEYKSSIVYIQQIQKLAEYLGSNLVSPESLMQNIHSELQKRHLVVIEEDLYTPLVGIYFNNLCTLKISFKELESFYTKSCKNFEERFKELAQSAHEPIFANEFSLVAEIIRKVSKCLPILNDHLHGLVEEKYKEIVQSLLQHLNRLSEKAEPILARIILSENEVEIVKDCVKILKSAKENHALDDRISTYVEMLTKENDKMADNVKSLSDIYSVLIEKIVNHFNQIDNMILELFKTNGDRALEDTETLVNAVNMIRTIPEIELLTAGAYYSTIGSIRGHMYQLQRDAEQLLLSIDHQSGTQNYAKIARLLSRLKGAKWMNRVSPGAYDISINRVTEDLVQYFHQLEDKLMKLDLNLKYPDNVCVAEEIFEKIESLGVLERSVPELKKSREAMMQRFLGSVQANFNCIQEKFNLQENSVYQTKQELKELEQIKREYDNLHPALIFLQKHDFLDINKLDDEIDGQEKKQKIELEQEKERRSKIESELNALKSIIQYHEHMRHSNVDQDKSRKEQNTDDHLRLVEDSSIDTIRETVVKTEERLADQLEIIQEKQTKYNNSLAPLKSIKNQYESLLITHDSVSSEQINFLQEKGQESIELLTEIIEKKKKIITERQKNKQSHDFSIRFDASTADIALLYTSNCGRIANVRLKEIAADIHDILKKYICEYGFFLDQEIRKLFTHLTTIGSQEDLSQCSQDLETHLEDLSSLSEFKHVFECIEGAKKIDHWRRKFSERHRVMSVAMEEYKSSGNNKELKEQLTMAQGLMHLDQFCGDTFLSKGFATLYKQYQVELNKEFKQAYETVRNCISNGDYAKVDMELVNIDEKTTNRKEIESIKHYLQTSLKNLMQSTRSIINGLDQRMELMEQNQSQTEKINENIEKIHIVLSKSRLMEFIQENTKSDLLNFEESIKKLLCEILLKELNSIEEFMDNDDAFEAEQRMEKFRQVQQEFASDFTMVTVTEKANEVRKRLDNLASNILKQNDFKNIEKYAKKPPKDLLSKLEKAASHCSQKYTKVCSSILSDIQDYFDAAIKNACEAPIEKRHTQMISLNSIVRYLPEGMQKSLKPQMDELTKKFIDEEREYRRDLKDFLENETINDSAIKRIGELALTYKKENRDEPLEILRNGVIKKLDNHLKSVQNALDSKDIQSAVNNMKQIIKYKENVQNISEIDEFYKQVCTLTSTYVTNYAETFTDIFKIEKTQIVDQAFSNMIAYIELGEEFPQRTNELLPENVLQNVEIGLKKLYDNWNNISNTFDTAMNELNIKSIREVTSIIERWDGFLNKIRNCYCRHNLIQRFLNAMKNIKLYSETMSELKKMIIYLKQSLDVKLISDETTRFEAMCDQFFSKLGMYFKALKSISSEFKNILLSETDMEKIETGLKEKVEHVKKKLLDCASKDGLSHIESDYFRTYYNHLVYFDKYVRLPEAKIQDTLELAEAKIFQQVKSLSKDIAGLDCDVTKFAESLVKMKFFAENFSMFEMKINAIIDDVLKSYKTQHGALTLSQLSMILEKTDEGARLVVEHSCLSAEDWRKRREKMQKQDDLDYIIGELKGDDLATDVLRSRYKTFRKMYDNLISNILAAFNPTTQTEPDLEVLITQTKVLIGTIVQKANEISWDHSFRDRIPELLAHIFAVWTLKNTQHYNAMRGIDASNTYLLMPHAAQVIAIFRILGIGYKEYKTFKGYKVPLTGRISDDLINNLVQMGTGEGKSVVIAVTACVFALVGVDVDCSCYSEYLSMRDKNDFAPVFRALGIEEHIQYGTFNKLCENFLNEQCNIREKVHDMIMNNKNAMDVIHMTACIRPKVLLIDEVDVFLSEKYYGGMYTSAVYLKDSSINTLLDTLWKNRNLRALNAVKVTPAYQACATRFSNWIFLFDEAIKDMLAALQSFQSSTYIIQNDKIVYVEGESIAENVVRGYDTIWAYYFENEKGFISQSSLETNVGIIINCGTFSYAEMPHEFAYITGVTGTLKTLAEPEKNILQKVYEIHKNTYMPSVFGKSNRNYNPTNDVEAVNKSEYFMRIRGEIDAICNAQRAIFVFFELEEKLMSFYNSSELSSIKQNVQIITEKVSTKERELCIKRAATGGKATLLTRTFGRGTDFICRNRQVLANGGIHVLQTFFSEELSEEYQIMGRGARQGDRGSYRMILLDCDLERFLGADWDKKISKITGSTLYDTLNKARNALYESKCAAKEVGIEQCRHEHQVSKSFMDALLEGKMDIVKKVLTEKNRGANIASGISRTLLLMDATGSMKSLLSATKDTVCTMFERASAVLEEKGISKDAFSMQFAVYRNYNCRDNKILEVSPWETKASNLRTFINRIGPEGGKGHEAIEIGLWHAVKESERQDEISQVILIGDAPANTKTNVAKNRAQFGEAYWKQSRFATPTYYEDELEKLKTKNIPIHAFYLTDYAKDNFQKIAKETKGRCEWLDISSTTGAESLTNFVTEEVLRKSAGDQGDAAVELYKAKYVKKMFIS
ncbi:unnamed protein product [Rotaria sp. Silwood2]|nr:unnamed protein product [Rotaria sp. Silwood2]